MLDEKRTFRSPKKVNHSFLYSEQCNELIFVPSTLIRKKKKLASFFASNGRLFLPSKSNAVKYIQQILAPRECPVILDSLILIKITKNKNRKHLQHHQHSQSDHRLPFFPHHQELISPFAIAEISPWHPI
jgi:hypothetical protein